MNSPHQLRDSLVGEMEHFSLTFKLKEATLHKKVLRGGPRYRNRRLSNGAGKRPFTKGYKELEDGHEESNSTVSCADRTQTIDPSLDGSGNFSRLM